VSCRRIDNDLPLSTRQLADYDPFAMTAWPLEKIEPNGEKVVDDETSFPKSMLWFSFLYVLIPRSPYGWSAKGTSSSLLQFSFVREGAIYQTMRSREDYGAP
jgi:hypothetical protein